MSKINLPYHLIVPTIISILLLVIIFTKKIKLIKNGKRKIHWFSIMIFFVIYLAIVGGAMCSDIYLQWSLNNFDLNRDGFFNGNEITFEQQEAMNNLINDTGRNFSFITGFVFLGIISITFFMFGKTYKYLKPKQSDKNLEDLIE